MKVILVSGFDPAVTRASGIRSYVMALSRQLAVLKQEVSVLSVGSKPTNVAGVEFIPVAESVESAPEFTRALKKCVKRNRNMEGVVHAQRPDDLLPFHSKCPDLPKIVTLHGVHGFHVRARRGAVAGWLYGMAEKYSLKRTDAALCVSRDTLEYFSRKYLELSPIFRMVPAGISLATFDIRDKVQAREKLGLAKEGKLIAFVGRFEPEKNPELVLKEFLHLSKRHKDAHLVMIGNGQLVGSLRNMAGTVKDSVLILDPLPQEELAQYLCASDILAVSSYHEGLPTVALETLACGTPVVGTPVGILPEVIKEGINGYMVGSEGELGGAIEKALYRTEWSAAACRDSVRGFGWDKVASSILEIYRQAAERKKGGASVE